MKYTQTAFATSLLVGAMTLYSNAFAANFGDKLLGTQVAGITPTTSDSSGFLAVIGNLINFFLSLIGIIATGYLMYAGFMYMMNGENKIKDRIIQTIVGIGVILVAQFVVSFATGADIFFSGGLGGTIGSTPTQIQ